MPCLQIWKHSRHQFRTARDNVKEFSRIGVNNAKTFEQVARETTTTTATATISP